MRQLMPAEWEPHSACLLLCPHNAATFRLVDVEAEFLNVVRAIVTQGHEKVVLGCFNEEQCVQYRKLTADLGEMVYCVVCPSNDSWARDTAPTFVITRPSNMQQENSLVALDWDFNAYGGPNDGCYWPCEQDRLVASTLTRTLMEDTKLVPSDTTTESIPLVLEGGSIHTDGQGTLLTTAECLLNKNRNPDKSQAEIERIVLQATGCTKMIWLDYGLASDDDTNGHVDNWACFVQPGHVVLAWTDDETNQGENYRRCRHSLAQLESATDARGHTLTIHKLYLPDPMFYTDEEIESLTVKTPTADNPAIVEPRQVGEALAGSYVNFYIANQAVVVPQYGDLVHDAKALETLRPLFPNREVVGVATREILIGGGNIHCITQQVPRLS